mgnify:CR=1 FL=1
MLSVSVSFTYCVLHHSPLSHRARLSGFDRTSMIVSSSNNNSSSSNSRQRLWRLDLG